MSRTVFGGRIFRIAAACALLLISSTGCVEEAGPDTFELGSSPTVVIPAKGGRTAVTFEASGKWTATVSAEGSGWLTVSPESGDKTVTGANLSAKANLGTDERAATVEFRCGSASVTVSVTQLPKDALVLSPSTVSVGEEGGEFSIETTGNVSLNVSIADDWVHMSNTRAMTSKTYTFIADSNWAYEERNTTITFTGGSITQTITVTQSGKKGFSAEFKPEYTISARAQTLVLKAMANTGVRVEPQADWIHVSGTRALDQATMTLEIDANPTDSRRTGKVAVIASNSADRQEVTIVQAGASEMFIPDDAFRGILLAKFDTNGDGSLSRAEFEAADELKISYQEYPAAADIESLEGIEYFTNISGFTFDCALNGYNPHGKVSGTIDLSSNKKLMSVGISCLASLEGLDISGVGGRLRSLLVVSCPALKQIKWPHSSGLESVNLNNCPQLVRENLDFSEYLALGVLEITACPGLSKVLLPNGSPTVVAVYGGTRVEYVGDNLKVAPVYADPVFGKVLDKVVTDSDGDGIITVMDLKRARDLVVYGFTFNGIQGTVSSLEDLGQLSSLGSLSILDCNGLINAPLPESLSSLTSLTGVSIRNTKIYGQVPASYASLTSHNNIEISGTDISGSLPEGLFRLPLLTYIDFRDNPGLNGDINLGQVGNTGLKTVYLSGCNFNSCRIEESPESLLDHLAPDAAAVYFEPQVNGNAKLIYRSKTDGTGSVHSDGEAVLYHAATKGPGLDIFITGDGFTRDNNTVGGTLETYMKYAADAFMSQDPFNKLMEWFNIWLVYAHSQKEGTALGSRSTEGLKFSSFQPDAYSSTCSGDIAAVSSFVKSSTGRNEPTGTVCVIMNSSTYGGMTMIPMTSLYAPGLATAFVPASHGFSLTAVHEALGHGFAKLGDEYNASSAGAQTPSTDNTLWPLYGAYSNFDNVSDPARVRWHDFIADYRYAGEGLGVFEGANHSNTGWYRATGNSIMNNQFGVGGDRFNAPSREAIWQRVQLLTHPGQNWPDWATFVSSGYNREDFVAFDLAPAPSTRIRRPVMRSTSATFKDPQERNLPAHAPPVILK